MSNDFVTQKEYVLKPEETIVSKTDLYGNIKEANEAFIEASGYSWSELIDQPHNILRHPDVPQQVFEDFWRTIQSGKPWTQIVKNRRKNGDHYWVVANATPIFEGEEIVGYMSVRTKATAEQVADATTAYERIRAGELSLFEGKPKSFNSKFKPIAQNHLNLQALAFVLLLVSTAVSLYTQPDTLNFVYVLPLLAIALYGFSYIALKKDLNEVYQQVTRIAAGDLQYQIDVSGHGAITKIQARLKSMQIRLGADLEEVKHALNDSKRIQSALNATSSNIMVADRFRSIIFMNDGVQALLKEIEPQIKEQLPDFDVENLHRQSIDTFHVNPQHQINIVDNLQQTYKARITLGDEIVDLILDPIFDDGVRLGTVVEWRKMTEQIYIESEINQILESAARGVLNKRLDVENIDEGFNRTLSIALNRLLEQMLHLMEQLANSLESVSKGDLTVRLNLNLEGDVGRIETSINTALESLEGTLTQVKSGAGQIGNMSYEVSQASNDLSIRTQEQAASIEQTTANVKTLAERLHGAAQNTGLAGELISDVVSEAEKSVQVMSQASNAMSTILSLSSKVTDITSIIDGIAFQTNLLALNAAVEAARAGEHGRGFAVVAGEVRALAQKSAESSKEISSLVSLTTQNIDSGSLLVEETSHAFNAVVEKVQDISGLIHEIDETTQEQSSGLTQISGSIESMDDITQQNAALVEELSATAANMSEEASIQAEYVNRFKLNQSLLSELSNTAVLKETDCCQTF